MCRMLGMVSARPTAVRELLLEAPRSLAVLSNEHRDGWGIATSAGGDWQIRRSTSCAARCADYSQVANVEAELVIAHVRKATVGRLSLSNTHPFRHDRFVFAHNGTVLAIAALVSRIAPEHLAWVGGDTDSERLFAYILTHVGEAGSVERGVIRAIAAMRALGDIGSASFLLSCGERLYAYRCGRTLFTRMRGTVTMVASEPLTDESWTEIPELGLVVLDRPRTSSEHPLAA
jgi:glutamine amidotransferase